MWCARRSLYVAAVPETIERTSRVAMWLALIA